LTLSVVGYIELSALLTGVFFLVYRQLGLSLLPQVSMAGSTTVLKAQALAAF